MIYGAVIGDVIGSRFEFDRGGKTKSFKLFTDECTYTDDTVMTLAIADALADENVGKDADEETIKSVVTEYMQIYGRAIPNAGYGRRFIEWIWDNDPKPYNSFGNGSAMRTSVIGWLYSDLDRTRQVARWVAEITHNHPEGVKGAECTAAVIWLARHGTDKKHIKKFVQNKFGYNLSYSVVEWRRMHKHVESCMDSMPKALTAFFEGRNFEDVIRNAVSLGGDTDTIGAIAGSMAEAYHEIPADIKTECIRRLPNNLSHAITQVELELSRNKEEI